MKIEDILQALPTREDLAAAVGLEARSSAPADMLAALGTGVLLGAALAVLFAPKSGREVRRDIGEKLDEMAGQFHTAAAPSTETHGDPVA